jgi:hypothetical protein
MTKLCQRGNSLKHSYTPENIKARTAPQLKNLLENALRLGAEDVTTMVQEEMALRLYGDELPAEVSAKLDATLQEHERRQAEEAQKKTFKDTRTRLAIRRTGLKKAVETIVQKGDFPTLPFALTFEATILEHPDLFSADAVETARKRQDLAES